MLTCRGLAPDGVQCGAHMLMQLLHERVHYRGERGGDRGDEPASNVADTLVKTST